MEVFVVISTVLALTAAAPGVTNVDNPSNFRDIISTCLASTDTMTCLSIKGITALNRAARIAKIEIFPGVSIRRDLTISARSANAISENEIIDSLPDEESGRSGYLFDLTMDALVYFIDSHTLEVNFPKAIARAIEGGRIIKKKYMSAVALALALKALIIAKIALFMKHHKGGHHSSLVEMVTDIAN